MIGSGPRARVAVVAVLLLAGGPAAAAAVVGGAAHAGARAERPGAGRGGPVSDGIERVIVALGDSLTAGLGVAPDEAYPALLHARLTREGFRYRVVNAGVSGDTSAGGLARLDWVLRAHPEIAIVALGANDGLRGQPPAAMRANLAAILDRLRSRGVKTLLAGMRLPPNYGEAYTREFAAVFADLGRRADAFMPFLLDGVAAVPALNQEDGIHPNAGGHRRIAEQLWRHLRPLLAAGAPSRPARRGASPRAVDERPAEGATARAVHGVA
jgi:acyl-CoA thioesterase-1